MDASRSWRRTTRPMCGAIYRRRSTFSASPIPGTTATVDRRSYWLAACTWISPECRVTASVSRFSIRAVGASRACHAGTRDAEYLRCFGTHQEEEVAPAGEAYSLRRCTTTQGESMSRPHPSSVEQRWQEVLRRADIALQRPGVGVWEADPRGRLRLLAASDAEAIAPVVADDLEPTLRELRVLPGSAPSRWVASRLKGRRWCIAPVRCD